MFCPKCGLEYREGFEECAYCHISLIDELPEDFSENDDENLNYESTADGTEESDAKDDEYEADIAPSKPFRSAEEQAADMKSSGLTLLFVSIIGIVFLLMCYTGALPIRFVGMGAVITYSVMGALFLIFFVFGVRALKTVNSLEEEAQRENEKFEEISKWFLENHSSESIDSSIDENSANDTGADVYFERVSYMKESINNRFTDLDPQFLDYIVDSLYSEVFAEK